MACVLKVVAKAFSRYCSMARALNRPVIWSVFTCDDGFQKMGKGCHGCKRKVLAFQDFPRGIWRLPSLIHELLSRSEACACRTCGSTTSWWGHEPKRHFGHRSRKKLANISWIFFGNLAFYVPIRLQLAHEGDVEMPLVKSKTPLASDNSNISLTRAINRLVRVQQKP